MEDNLNKILSRRSFLRRGSCAALGLGGLTSQLFTMRTLGAALDGGRYDDYKALVCIFLFGGNDSGNTLIPWDGGDENYVDYAAQRTTLAMSQADLEQHVIAPTNTNGRRFALHPALSGVRGLFDQGNVALLADVGTLLYPMTRDEYRDNIVPRPSQLFAHNRQQDQWQLSTPSATDGLGWGGRVADMLQANGANPSSNVSMNMSIAGHSRFLTGRQVEGYSVSPWGPELLNLYHFKQRHGAEQAFLDMIAVHQDASHPASTPMGKVIADVTQRSQSNGLLIDSLLANSSQITAQKPDQNWLADQLAMAARLIEFGRSGLQHDRQVFFVALGGFDNHDGLLGDSPTTGPHGGNLKALNDALMYFWDALGDIGMRDSVTTFTASDFGRTYRSNGNGSDHGWAGHHLVMGGSQVKGNKVYGNYGSIITGGAQDTWEQGQFIPTTSVDAYGFELARWMGVPLSEIDSVFPHIGRFLDVYNPSTHLGMLG